MKTKPPTPVALALVSRDGLWLVDRRRSSDAFDGLWEFLIPRERARVLNLLLSAVEYDGEAGTVSVTFRPTSIGALMRCTEEAAVCQP